MERGSRIVNKEYVMRILVICLVMLSSSLSLANPPKWMSEDNPEYNRYDYKKNVLVQSIFGLQLDGARAVNFYDKERINRYIWKDISIMEQYDDSCMQWEVDKYDKELKKAVKEQEYEDMFEYMTRQCDVC